MTRVLIPEKLVGERDREIFDPRLVRASSGKLVDGCRDLFEGVSSIELCQDFSCFQDSVLNDAFNIGLAVDRMIAAIWAV